MRCRPSWTFAKKWRTSGSANLTRPLASLNGITDDQKRAVEAMSQAIVNKLLHAPLVVLKQAASTPGEGDNTIAVARRLFNLDKELKRPGHDEDGGVR